MFQVACPLSCGSCGCSLGKYCRYRHHSPGCQQSLPASAGILVTGLLAKVVVSTCIWGAGPQLGYIASTVQGCQQGIVRFHIPSTIVLNNTCMQDMKIIGFVKKLTTTFKCYAVSCSMQLISNEWQLLTCCTVALCKDYPTSWYSVKLQCM